MSAWDTYRARMNVRGNTKRETVLNREIRTLNKKLPDSLSYQTATIFDCMHGVDIESDAMKEFGISQNVAVINSDNLNEKHIISFPGEDISAGSLVCWMGQHWLVTERDANTTVYTKCKMVQCNYLLKYIDDNHQIHEQWVLVEDGTKYLTGELEDRQFIVARGDSRIAITIARNPYSAKLDRQSRFLIDDPWAEHMLAYLLTKPLKFSGVYNGEGVFKFVLQEVVTTDDDNLELGIADYYKHFPKQEAPTPPDDGGSKRKQWL